MIVHLPIGNEGPSTGQGCWNSRRVERLNCFINENERTAYQTSYLAHPNNSCSLIQPNSPVNKQTNPLEALAELLNTYTKKTSSNSSNNTSIHNNTTEEKAPLTEEASKERAFLKTNTIIYRRNRYKHTHTQNIDNHTTHITSHDIICPQPHTNHINPIIDEDDDALVILAKHTTLTETQIKVLRKGLKFIPKPKKLSIQTLHADFRNFMHRIKN